VETVSDRGRGHGDALKVDIRDHKYVDPKQIPLPRQVAAAWLEKQRNLHPATFGHYRNQVEHHFKSVDDYRVDLIDEE